METYLTRVTDYLLTQSWQIALLVVVIAAVSLALKNKSAHVRYLLWLIVIAKCLAPPLFTIPLAILPEEEISKPAAISTRAKMLALEPEVPDMSTAESVELPSRMREMPPRSIVKEERPRITIHEWIGTFWIVGAGVFLIFNLMRALRANFWLWRRREKLPAELRSNIERLFSAHGIKNFPSVWLVDGFNQPFVWGLLRGSIYLPANFLKINQPKHQRSVLGHELSHIVRFDAAVNLLQVIAQAIFWFHPFVWWANRKIRQEREKCCDEMAIVRLNTLPRDYSTAILEILSTKYESTRPVPSLAVAGPVKNIEERIKTMMKPGKKFYKHPSFVAATIVLLLALLTVPSTVVLTARAQSRSATASGDKPAGSLPYRAADAGPTSLGPIVNSSTAEGDPHISADGIALYFASERAGGLGDRDLWVTTRETKDDPWGTPVNLGSPINSSAYEGAPCTSADGLELYFVSGRPGGSGTWDIWVSTRQTQSDPWGAPVNLGPTVNSPLKENSPSISADGLKLYFSDYWGPRPGGMGATDICVTTRKTKDGPWGKPVNLGPPVNSVAHEWDPDISADGLSLYFSSRRSPGLGGDGFWVATRKTQSDSWGTPVNLGPTVNSTYDAYEADISSDGSTLYFITDRPESVSWSYSYNIWQVILEKGDQASSLQSAAFFGDLARVKAFLDAGFDVNQKNALGVTALYSAASGGHKEVVELLLAEGADINEKTAAYTDVTTLHAAAREGHKEIVEVLLAAGADVNAGSTYNELTAAELAMEANHIEVVKLLIAKGADISALHFAIHMKDYAKAKSLIESGADVNKRKRRLDAPLHLAASSGQKDVAELLIAKGANINIRNSHGRTPLHLAVREDDRDMVELLVTKGADINAKSEFDGWISGTPLDLAIDEGHTEIIELLRKHGAKE
ncbi:MAG: ankyrin repeat domain-containing protein [Sedimentisphaerales bacterium]